MVKFSTVCDCSSCANYLEDNSVGWCECAMADNMTEDELEEHWVNGCGHCRYYQEKGVWVFD